MEKEKTEQIIGYRIGQGLFCVECYEKDAKKLKSVQNPEDPEVKLPSRPITAEDVSIFICEDCKAIKGPCAEDIKIQKPLSFSDLQDNINNCIFKIAFLEDFCATSDEDALTEDGMTGLFFILHGLRDDLNLVKDQLREGRHGGLIIEKEKVA